jgi:hypothetical protein
MRRFLLAAAVATVLALSGPRAAVAAPGDNPPEIGLGAGQLLMGTAIASLALALPVFLDGTPFELLGLAALFAGPAAVGGTVCTLGQNSKLYGGTCGSAMIGAYLGAIAALPLAFVAVAPDNDDGDGGNKYASGSVIALMVGYALGTSIGATIGWHVGKEERSVWSRRSTPPPLSGADGQRWPELRWRPVRGARVAPSVSVPLLVFAF